MLVYVLKCAKKTIEQILKCGRVHYKKKKKNIFV